MLTVSLWSSSASSNVNCVIVVFQCVSNVNCVIVVFQCPPMLTVSSSSVRPQMLTVSLWLVWSSSASSNVNCVGKCNVNCVILQCALLWSSTSLLTVPVWSSMSSNVNCVIVVFLVNCVGVVFSSSMLTVSLWSSSASSNVNCVIVVLPCLTVDRCGVDSTSNVVGLCGQYNANVN